MSVSVDGGGFGCICGLDVREDNVVDFVALFFDHLDDGAKGIGDVVDEGVGDPVGGDGHVVFQLTDAAADVRGVRGHGEVELHMI